MALNNELKRTKFGIKLNDEQISNIEKLGQAYYSKWHTMPNVIRYERLDYDTIVNVLNTMLETGDNFAKVYMQLYFEDIRERYEFNIQRGIVLELNKDS